VELLEEEEPLKLENCRRERLNLPVKEEVSNVGQWRRRLGGWCASGWAVFFVFFFQTIRVKEGLDPVFY